MLSGPFALALAAGMAATVNPCGFALLPAYLAMFIGDSRNDAGRGAAIGRAVAVSATLTAGFVVVFGVFGLVISPLAVQVERFLPWVTVVIGLGLVGLGVTLLRGREITMAIPKLAKGGKDGGLVSMFLFGVSYAVASLSCTIGPFLAVTSTTLRTESIASGVGVFIAYGLGMGLIVTALTVAAALAKAGLAASLRRALPYVTRISGALLLIAGAYVAWYGYFEIRTLNGGNAQDPIVNRALDIQVWLQQLFSPDQPVRLALILAVAVALVAVTMTVVRRRSRPAGHEGDSAPGPSHEIDESDTVRPQPDRPRTHNSKTTKERATR